MKKPRGLVEQETEQEETVIKIEVVQAKEPPDTVEEEKFVYPTCAICGANELWSVKIDKIYVCLDCLDQLLENNKELEKELYKLLLPYVIAYSKE